MAGKWMHTRVRRGAGKREKEGDVLLKFDHSIFIPLGYKLLKWIMMCSSSVLCVASFWH